MNLRTIAAALAATLFSHVLIAQTTCPKERAVDVPRQIITGNSQDCGGISVNIGGVQVHDAAGGCPLFIIYEPEHSATKASDALTRTSLQQLLPVTHMTFECQRKWFLLIPYDTACRQTGTKAMGVVRLMETVPCELGTQS